MERERDSLRTEQILDEVDSGKGLEIGKFNQVASVPAMGGGVPGPNEHKAPHTVGLFFRTKNHEQRTVAAIAAIAAVVRPPALPPQKRLLRNS